MLELMALPTSAGLARSSSSPPSQRSWPGEDGTAAVVVTDFLSDAGPINALLGEGVLVLLIPHMGVPARPKQATPARHVQGVPVRRQQTEAAYRAPEPGAVGVGRLEVDLDRHSVRWQGRQLDLSEHEIGILACLADRAGRAYSFIDLFGRVWGSSHHIDPTVVHSAVQRLRRKFAAAEVAVTIESVRAFGFRLTCPSSKGPIVTPLPRPRR
jgi:DNA-binding winged helix-turn-helix (wHTH) protein